MRTVSRNCASLGLTARRAWLREAGFHALSRRLSSTASANATGIQSGLPFGQTHTLRQRRFGGILSPAWQSRSWTSKARTEPPVLDSRAPQKLGGRNQVRGARSSSNAGAEARKEEKEELLERFETKKGEESRPQRQVLNSDGEGSRSAGHEKSGPEIMNKGKLLTTPSRLFKLIIPLTTVDNRGRDKGIEPIAILVHPQQPLSYLERLIQSEVPPIKGQTDELRPPVVSFIALQHDDGPIKPKKKVTEDPDTDSGHNEAETRSGSFDPDQHPGAGVPVEQRRRSREEDAEIYSYTRRTEPAVHTENGDADRFVRWSQATEVGDFIRDAARVREFIIMIEGAPSGLGHICVAVPSFSERTHFLRMRLRKLSRRIQGIAEVKHKCDALAHRGAQRVALGGFGVLSLWWYLVYKLTFGTDLGWDTMEPVTYLVSLSTLMGGYLWFLYHNREMSYRSALDFTISARQKKLYQQHNVDLQLWESLIDEGNSLRREIKNIAAEYDAEWNERADEQDERVTEALKAERHHKHGKSQRRDGNDSRDRDDD